MVVETPSCHMMIELSRHVSLKKRTDEGFASLSEVRIEVTKWHTRGEAIMS